MPITTTKDFVLLRGTYNPGKLPYQIPNASRLDLVKWLRELDFKVGVEVGVAEGEFSKILCEVNPQMKVYGVDMYQPYRGYSDYVKRDTFQQMREQAMQRLMPYIERDRYQLIDDDSSEAVKQFEDGSLDFVYIDGNHEYPFVDRDIEMWTEKVRSGGIVAGHDYVRVRRVKWGVKEAVQKYTKQHNISPWYVLGLDNVIPGMVREGARSWMFIKP